MTGDNRRNALSLRCILPFMITQFTNWGPYQFHHNGQDIVSLAKKPMDPQTNTEKNPNTCKVDINDQLYSLVRVNHP